MPWKYYSVSREDGMDYIKIENQPLNHFKSNFARLERDHKFAANEDFSQFLAPKTVKELKSNKKFKQVLNDYFNRIVEDYHMLRSFIFKDYLDSNVRYPVNLNRLIANAKTRFDIQNNMSSDLNPLYVIDKIGRLTSMLRVERGLNGMKLFPFLFAHI